MKKILLFVCLLALCNLTLFAQNLASRMVHTTEKSAVHVSPEEAQAGLKIIFGNLGKKGDLYDDTSGFAIIGPAVNGTPTFYALPFTPKVSGHASQVQVAVQYVSGDN